MYQKSSVVVIHQNFRTDYFHMYIHEVNKKIVILSSLVSFGLFVWRSKNKTPRKFWLPTWKTDITGQIIN